MGYQSGPRGSHIRVRCTGRTARWVAAGSLVWLVCALPATAVALDVVGVARVVDGDTLDIAGEKVRLHGIDAPESDQLCRRAGAQYACGAMASQWMVEQTSGKTVTCSGSQRDRYGRLIAVCRVGGTDLNEGIVRVGWAVAFLRYSHAYAEDEAAAQRERVGLWAGEFERPAEHRRAGRANAEQSRAGRAKQVAHAQQSLPPDLGQSTDACAIKGNVNNRGQRIYHVPGDRWFGRLQLHPRQGDRCFLSVEEAESAGFRAALR